jgi:hypothetical protein
MKRFLLFTFASYYPQGGWSDFRASYDTVQDAQIALANRSEQDKGWEVYYQVVDTETMQVVDGELTPDQM